jgi:hypothetical protein
VGVEKTEPRLVLLTGKSAQGLTLQPWKQRQRADEQSGSQKLPAIHLILLLRSM